MVYPPTCSLYIYSVVKKTVKLANFKGNQTIFKIYLGTVLTGVISRSKWHIICFSKLSRYHTASCQHSPPLSHVNVAQTSCRRCISYSLCLCYLLKDCLTAIMFAGDLPLRRRPDLPLFRLRDVPSLLYFLELERTMFRLGRRALGNLLVKLTIVCEALFVFS